MTNIDYLKDFGHNLKYVLSDVKLKTRDVKVCGMCQTILKQINKIIGQVPNECWIFLAEISVQIML